MFRSLKKINWYYFYAVLYYLSRAIKEVMGHLLILIGNNAKVLDNADKLEEILNQQQNS